MTPGASKEDKKNVSFGEKNEEIKEAEKPFVSIEEDIPIEQQQSSRLGNVAKYINPILQKEPRLIDLNKCCNSLIDILARWEPLPPLVFDFDCQQMTACVLENLAEYDPMYQGITADDAFEDLPLVIGFTNKIKQVKENPSWLSNQVYKAAFSLSPNAKYIKGTHAIEELPNASPVSRQEQVYSSLITPTK